ncbi:hypothetical protein GGTG_10597 [Gaeumannomyces tritici R3-111a-1]|uniref:Uncharacterized protein n=1 Tax=Gaeumannomyces tritici (strain R3-111a-1) TaxID=644352 RepID=J3PAS2_GAET3|nr:hypothetical protein GGTG_10597 [Gaeumannomyces tritici R3-111a-1]EJT71338.1 hypothetical protein GGTG_10597 [Gaeumannomyces tritici R3-111a-1]
MRTPPARSWHGTVYHWPRVCYNHDRCLRGNTEAECLKHWQHAEKVQERVRAQDIPLDPGAESRGEPTARRETREEDR